MKTLLAALALTTITFASHADTYGPYPQETYQTCGSPLSQTAAVLIHGGAWFTGATQSPDVLKLCTYLGLHNVYVVSIDYRASTTAPWPAQLQDAQLALRWLRRNVKAKRVGVIGLSAGGQIALSMSFQSRMEYAGTDPMNEDDILDGMSSHPDFVVDVSGPTDLTVPGFLPAGIASLTKGTFMSDGAARAFASPVVHISRLTSPLLISHGTEDPVVPIAQSDTLVAALQQAGLTVSTTDSQADSPPVTPATVVYDRHAGKHLFAGTRYAAIYLEILKFAKGTGL